MKEILSVLVVSLVLTLPWASARTAQPEDEERYEIFDDDQGPEGPQTPQLLQQVVGGNASAAPSGLSKPESATDDDERREAMSAKEAAKVANKAAAVANKVAKHSVKIIGHSKKALKHALGALHEARVDSVGLAKSQKESLKKAGAHLREATKTANYGKLGKLNKKDLDKRTALQKDLDKSNRSVSEREQMREEIQELRKKLREKNVDDKDIDRSLDDLEHDTDLKEGPVNDESKGELERLRQVVDSLESQEVKDEKSKPRDKNAMSEAEDENAIDEPKDDAGNDKSVKPLSDGEGKATPIQEKGFDIDTQMPYGDLEPFGREDTAQELTEASIRESDDMVDQLERAEVAEEKRAVFRALTRLRGAAITSFDGVARSQTGNIEEYNKLQKWRSTHPLHHLADEESDVSKWAFPDNAD